MDDRWAAVRDAAARHRADSFPDCRGAEIEGVDLVMVDADLAGCVESLVSSKGRSADHVSTLRDVVSDLNRIVPQMRSAWAPYFERARDLGNLTLEAVG